MIKLIFIIITAFAMSSVQAKDGASLYSQHCAACHGSQGNGGVGVPLALPDFQQSVSDDFLAKTIRHGRPGRVMPAFKNLSDDELNSLVKHLRSWQTSDTKPKAITVEAGNVQHGKQLFTKHCSSCHGAQGEGGHGTGVTFSRPRDLPIIAPALNNSGFLASASDNMVKSTLMHGRKGTPMTSFLKQGLSERDIDDLVSYVRSFAKHPYDKQVARPEMGNNIIRIESPHTMEKTIDNIKRAAIGKNFRIIRVQTLDQGLVKEGQENTRQTIIYFCNFQLLNQALAIDQRVGLFLPCRITVVEKNGKVEAMSINPNYLSHIFNNAELNILCDEMVTMYQDILEEATL